MESKNLFSNWFVKNLLIAAVAFGVLLVACVVLLNVFTHHGQAIEVPDFTNLQVSQAEQAAHNVGMRVQVTDSVYVKRMDRGAVFSQVPKAGSMVKKGRRVQLVINSVSPKQVRMPDLIGFSMRQAKAELAAAGLSLRKLVYVSDIATNNVLRQTYRGREVAPGRKVESGAEIDLVVGLNEEDNMTVVPDVKGLRYKRAVDAVHDNSLNVGKLHFDKNIRSYSDSLDAVVYKQSPEVSESSVLMGGEVTLYLRKETSKE